MEDSRCETFSLRQDDRLVVDRRVYSLIPDMATGWRPKNLKIPAPIVLRFRETFNDALIQFYSSCIPNQPIAYLGPRYTTSLEHHENTRHDYNLRNCFKMNEMPPQVQSQLKAQPTMRRPFVGNHPSSHHQLQFDSNFESGNLDAVFRVDEGQYDLLLRPDTNTCGHTQWFYFKTQSNLAGYRVKFNILNNRKALTLFGRGMLPYVRTKASPQWQQCGFNCSYRRTTSIDRLRDLLRQAGREDLIEERNYMCLSFQYSFALQNQEVQFAYCAPFTYSQLKIFIQRIKKRANSEVQEGGLIIREEKLCTSLGGLDVPVLTITNESIDQGTKKTVLIMARIHPGESNSSYVVKGLLDYITSEAASTQRDSLVFKVVPMINPDGVVFGNFRTSLSGRDLNRQFRRKDNHLLPQILALKDYVAALTQNSEAKLSFFIDMHGHSIKKNVFCYGPEFDLWSPKYERSKQLPRLLARKTSIFRYKSCTFKIVPAKKTTARAYMQEFATYCYTLESSIGLCRTDNDTCRPFLTKDWEAVGKSVVEALFEAHTIIYDERPTVLKKKKNRLAIVPKEDLPEGLRSESKPASTHGSRSQKLLATESMVSMKYLSPIRNPKRLAKNNSLDQVEFPRIDEDECESDRFTDNMSDCESQMNSLPKKEMQELTTTIVSVLNNFNSVFGGKMRVGTSTAQRVRQSKSKIMKGRPSLKAVHSQMKLVPCLRNRARFSGKSMNETVAPMTLQLSRK